jgi:hypothetical protein
MARTARARRGPEQDALAAGEAVDLLFERRLLEIRGGEDRRVDEVCAVAA